MEDASLEGRVHIGAEHIESFEIEFIHLQIIEYSEIGHPNTLTDRCESSARSSSSARRRIPGSINLG